MYSSVPFVIAYNRVGLVLFLAFLPGNWTEIVAQRWKLMFSFEANSADQVWCKAAAEFVSGRESKVHSGRDGDTHELLRATFCIHDPRQRWISSRRPQINPAFAI